MKFKIFGKTNNLFSRQLSKETVNILKKNIESDDTVEFYDIDKPMGHDISLSENIVYVPTILCEDEGHELGFEENNAAVYDINLCQKWWEKIEDFIDEMLKIKHSTE